jgi:hypothetical protein
MSNLTFRTKLYNFQRFQDQNIPEIAKSKPKSLNSIEFQEARLKAEERERKKAEVRKRLEEAGSKKKAKKGFLTPERKKKLRVSFFRFVIWNLKF